MLTSMFDLLFNPKNFASYRQSELDNPVLERLHRSKQFHLIDMQ